MKLLLSFSLDLFFFRSFASGTLKRDLSPLDTHLQRKERLEEIARKLNIVHLDDWYLFNASIVKESGGRNLLRRFGNSLIKTLESIYPLHPWSSYKFKKEEGMWNSSQSRRAWLEKVGFELGVRSMEDWYHVRTEQISSKNSFLLKYHASLSDALMTLFPDYSWEPWRFIKTPHGFWNDYRNHRVFFDCVGKRLGIIHFEDWYRVNRQSVVDMGGGFLLDQFYGESLSSALTRVYPENDWKLWLFERVPPGYWDDHQHIVDFLQWVENRLQLRSINDWHRVSTKQLRDLGGDRLLEKFGGINNLLDYLYPGHFSRLTNKNPMTSAKNQTQLVNILKEALSDRAQQFTSSTTSSQATDN